MSQAQCSHSRVIRILDQTGVDHTSEHWECPDCLTRFWPEYIDMHRKRLRVTIATAVLSGIHASCTEGYPSVEASTRKALEAADYLISELDKQ